MCRERTNSWVGILLKEGGSVADHMPKRYGAGVRRDRVYSLGSSSDEAQKLRFCPSCRVRGNYFFIKILFLTQFKKTFFSPQ